MVFKSGEYVLGGPPAAETLFRMSTPEMAAKDEIADPGSGDELKRPEYAA